jgi:hypothetical protein
MFATPPNGLFAFTHRRRLLHYTVYNSRNHGSRQANFIDGSVQKQYGHKDIDVLSFWMNIDQTSSEKRKFL